MKQNKASKQVALGGIISALSLLFMFLTGIFPFADYALPAISGIMLIALVIEINKKTAYVAYIAVGILSLLIAPIKESAILFVFFFGYYPILKSSIEQIKSRVVEWIVKIGMFNVAMVTAYFTMMYVLGMSGILADLNNDFQYGVIAFWALGNVAFVVYDMALSRLIVMYCEKIRPKLKTILK
ncbi:MAG: hypothetical protein WAX04_00455 [Oscillospiraceae bacterium]